MIPYKKPKKEVNYSEGMQSSHCGICRFFQKPSTCEKVSGRIDPSYWCKLFEKKPSGRT